MPHIIHTDVPLLALLYVTRTKEIRRCSVTVHQFLARRLVSAGLLPAANLSGLGRSGFHATYRCSTLISPVSMPAGGQYGGSMYGRPGYGMSNSMYGSSAGGYGMNGMGNSYGGVLLLPFLRALMPLETILLSLVTEVDVSAGCA